MSRILAGCNERVPVSLDLRRGQAVFFSTPADANGTENQDAIGVWELDEGATVLGVADGMGGGPAGGEAALLAVSCIDEVLERRREGQALRVVVIDAFEAANERVRRDLPGAATTLVIVEIEDGCLRTYHAGDSGAILVGQRGRIRHETMAHSPTGYAVAAGVLSRDEVHDHDERHFISNCVGAAEMRIEIGPSIELAPRDTLLLASDGVLDNVRHDTLIETIRKGPLLEAAEALQFEARASVEGRGEVSGHADDATALLYRLPVRSASD